METAFCEVAGRSVCGKPGIAVGVGVGVGGGVTAAMHVSVLITLLSKVTAAVWAKTRPSKVAPVSIVIAVSANTLPLNEVVEPRVTELTALHQISQALPPVTDEPGEVSIVDADLKIQTPVPLRVRFPVSMNEPVEQYVPATSGDTRVRSCTPAYVASQP